MGKPMRENPRTNGLVEGRVHGKIMITVSLLPVALELMVQVSPDQPSFMSKLA